MEEILELTDTELDSVVGGQGDVSTCAVSPDGVCGCSAAV
ncbi:bacteriocin-like protein [Lentzea flaviverrucosa]|uniref:Bacteriocin-type signal sequence-containing protein n=1 Tax=Lentzea flaviverrucosa TaxID=200379 RepID=A0A1H9EML7_9PSEU|nr:bacteriocin-like protein [Lentzea flaviverrucosa]SEQ26879.1 bacteriocin-type signal sequence-containing protein [Lentzea flaviverrucosa]